MVRFIAAPISFGKGSGQLLGNPKPLFPEILQEA
jgi:hypothetical protein